MPIDAKGGKLERVDEIRDEVKRYFEERFKKDRWDRPVLEGMEFERLTFQEKEILEEKFSYQEIKNAIWESDTEKSSVQDGYNMNFIKFWEIVKMDIKYFINEFYGNRSLPKAITSSFFCPDF